MIRLSLCLMDPPDLRLSTLILFDDDDDDDVDPSIITTFFYVCTQRKRDNLSKDIV